jgi:DNA polymerase (family 10)
MGGKATKTENKVSRETVQELWAEIEPLLQQFCTRYELCGSYRRGKELIGDVDVVIIPVMGGQISMSPEARELYDKIMSNNKRTHTVYQTKEGPVQCDFYVAEEADWGAQVTTWTGSADLNIMMRGAAKKLGLKLNQYGVWKNEVRIAGATEEEVFAAVGFRWLDPTERNKKFGERRKWR